ncbi:MAG TPA: hypothetical protein ENO14_00575, partial [Chromatiales bacterium]|nr:hypothetical protein [Chromatiales bacterium]
ATLDLLLRHTNEIKRSPEHLRALEILYNGEVVKTDRHVGELIDALEATGRLDNSIVIITADHGQALGESGRMGHGPILWEEVLHVPLIIADMRNPEGRRVETTVGLNDLTPTILAYAGTEADWRVQARNLKPAVEGKELEPSTYYAEVELKKDAGPWFDKDQIAVYDNRFKLVYSPDDMALYDLSRDPMAENPVDRSAHSAQIDYLSGLAQDYLSTATNSREADLSEEDLETLRSLGYIQ